MKCGEWRSDANHKITIQSKSLTGDAYGGSSNSWTNQSIVRAVIMPMSGNETFRSAQLESRVTAKMIIRYQSALKDAAVTGKYRVTYDGRTYAVKYIRNLAEDMKNEGNRYQELFVEENGVENV